MQKSICRNDFVREFIILLSSNMKQIFRHTETQLVRCYPSGFRVDSSNFNPLHLWTYGIQYVL